MAVEFAYAQARAQPRHGERPDADSWSLLESSVGLAQFLHLVRGTALAARVEHFSAATSPHVIERLLRQEWRAEVVAAVRWAPLRWRAAVAWTAWLTELPAIDHLLGGDASPAWMAGDPVLSRLAGEDAETARASIEEMLPEITAGDGAWQAWLRHWRRLWPKDAADDPALLRLASAVERHRAGSESEAAGQWRSELEREAVRLLRANREQPVTIFCHLLLSALELHRLREGLVRRALFNDLGREVAA